MILILDLDPHFNSDLQCFIGTALKKCGFASLKTNTNISKTNETCSFNTLLQALTALIIYQNNYLT